MSVEDLRLFHSRCCRKIVKAFMVTMSVECSNVSEMGKYNSGEYLY